MTSASRLFAATLATIIVLQLGSAGAAPADAAPTSQTATGTLRIVPDFASPQLGNKRALRIYLPPGYAQNTGKRYPVLYMHDGQNLFDAKTAAYGVEWGIATTLDRLIASHLADEIIVVGIDNSPDRIAEYTPCCDPKYGGGKLDLYAHFLIDTVKPYIDAQLRTLPDRAHTAIMGSSLGGIASVDIALHHPDIFAMAGGVSSSFWWNARMLEKTLPAKLPLRFYIDAGTNNDGLEDTLAFRDALLAKGYTAGTELDVVVAEGGIHNEKSWAARVDRPLTWFFPYGGPRN